MTSTPISSTPMSSTQADAIPDHPPTYWGLIEHRAHAAQTIDDLLVVDDLVAHEHAAAEAVERALDDLDRVIDAGAEAARGGEVDLHARSVGASGRGVTSSR